MNQKKKFGVYYTPEQLVDRIYSVLPMKDIKSAIDICCGDGALLRPYDDTIEVLGLDIEPKYKHGITYDSLNNKPYTDEHFDLCIGNPPYRLLKKTDYVGNSDEMNEFVHKNGNNLFVAGLYKALEYNAEWYALIVPKNFLLMDGYKEVRNMILCNYTLYALIDLGQGFKGVRGEQVCIVFKKHGYIQKVRMLRNDSEYDATYKDFMLNRLWALFDSFTDRDLFYRMMCLGDRIETIYSCNVKEGIRGKDLDKFRLKNGNYNSNGDAVIMQRIYSAECGFKAVPASMTTQCNESIKRISTENPLCLVGLLHSKLYNYCFLHYLFNDSKLTLKSEYAKYLPRVDTDVLDDVVMDMLIHGWSKENQKRLDTLVYILFSLTPNEIQVVENFIERTWSKKWL